MQAAAVPPPQPTATSTCGYKEKGNINTPFELAFLNQVHRSNPCIDVVDRIPLLQSLGSHRKDRLKKQICESIENAHVEGIDLEAMHERTSPR